LGFVAVGVMAIGLTLPVGAGAASGTITLAATDPGWVSADVVGAVHRTVGCLPSPQTPQPPSPPWEPQPEPPERFPRCGWIPYATLGPAGDCSSPARRWPALGEGVQLVWSGGERTGAGSAQFDLRDLPLELGADAPLLCLSVIEAAKEAIVCIAVVPSPCPPYAIVARHYQLDSALLEPPALEVQETEATGQAFVIQAAPEQVAAKSRRKRCRKGKADAKSGRSKLVRPNRCGHRSGEAHKPRAQH
jgi:hypothetical protein